MQPHNPKVFVREKDAIGSPKKQRATSPPCRTNSPCTKLPMSIENVFQSHVRQDLCAIKKKIVNFIVVFEGFDKCIGLMQRELYQNLLAWKQSKYRNPLVLKGARQTRKTWLIKEFGRNKFENLYVLNCDKNTGIADVFSRRHDTTHIIRNLNALLGTRVQPANSLLFFDEIQQVPPTLTSLKYFCEDATQYYVTSAGSLLGACNP